MSLPLSPGHKEIRSKISRHGTRINKRPSMALQVLARNSRGKLEQRRRNLARCKRRCKISRERCVILKIRSRSLIQSLLLRKAHPRWVIRQHPGINMVALQSVAIRNLLQAPTKQRQQWFQLLLILRNSLVQVLVCLQSLLGHTHHLLVQPLCRALLVGTLQIFLASYHRIKKSWEWTLI